MDGLKLTAAAFFRSKGKSVVTEKEFIMGISMDLRWMRPADTEELLSLLLAEGHLEKDGEYLRPAFDIHGTDVPLMFRPPDDLVKGKMGKHRPAAPPADDLLSELMAKVEPLGMKRKEFIVSVNAIQKRINVDIEIAALLMLREKGVDISGYIDASYELIRSR
ncbi:MAG: DUF2240 family protein [Methanomassiliicoccaceae archaeon]|nr:DUF2240 family protein [Methanomassiliicoccaceae archaeon]